MVKTDHWPLEQIHKKNLMQATPCLQRMLLWLQPYDCDIKYLLGTEMVTANALSKRSPSNKSVYEPGGPSGQSLSWFS